MAGTKKTTLLEISTIVPDPQYVDIDGIKHELLTLDRLGLKEQLRLGKMEGRAQEIKAADEFTDDMIDDLVNTYVELVGAVLPSLSEKDVAALTLPQMQAIVGVFTEASGITIPTDESGETTSPQTSEK